MKSEDVNCNAASVHKPLVVRQNVLKKRDQVQAEYETKLEAVVFREDKKTPVSYICWLTLICRAVFIKGIVRPQMKFC